MTITEIELTLLLGEFFGGDKLYPIQTPGVIKIMILVRPAGKDHPHRSDPRSCIGRRPMVP